MESFSTSQSSSHKLSLLANHFSSQQTATEAGPKISLEKVTVDGHEYDELIDFRPEIKVKHEYFNNFGWGFKDTEIHIDYKNKVARVSGNRYEFAGKDFPYLIDWAEQKAGVDFKFHVTRQEDVEIDPSVLNHAFMKEIDSLRCFDRRSLEKWERIMHSRADTMLEIFTLRNGKFKRYADVVVYPSSHEHCLTLVELANKHDVALIPFGGGTNVTQSLLLSPHEKRMIVSVDMTRLNRIVWVDKQNMLACVQAGIGGLDLDNQLKANYGVVMGHEPDSVEFSTLGGWISTRASGMKKNYYGNIEDIVQNVKIVTSQGVMTKLGDWPRVSNGPDLNHIIMGSEGNIGLITEAIIRLRNVPEAQEYQSAVFPDFETGIKFIEAVAKTRIWPASIRVVDNIQFKGAHGIKERGTFFTNMIDSISMFYLEKIKGFDLDKISACTLLFEGTREEVERQKSVVFELVPRYNGILGGAENGKKGYQLTFAIAYVRDFINSYSTIGESLELAVPWSKVPLLCKTIREKITSTAKELGFNTDKMVISQRVTQIYETGACVYIYYSFNYAYTKIPQSKLVEVSEKMEEELRAEIIRCGGSLSHHHGIGKLRKRFMKDIASPAQITYMKEMKQRIDPKNIFAAGNTFYMSEFEEKDDLAGGKFGLEAKNLKASVQVNK